MRSPLIKIRINRNRCWLFLLSLVFAAQSNGQTDGNCNPSINITPLAYTLCLTPSFTATAFNAGNNPAYQWKKNGVIVGTNSPAYSGPLSTGDIVVCELTTTGCNNNVTVVSNSFVLEPFDKLSPEVTTAASQQVVCAGTEVTFTATNKSGNTNPSYQWFVNGTSVPGMNSATFSTPILTDHSIVQCMMTVPTCLTGGGSTKDYSDPIAIRTAPALKPGISISTTTIVACKGNPVDFIATASETGTTPLYQWKINDNAVPGGGLTFSSSAFKDGDKVSCQLNVDPSSNCGIPASALSNTIVVKVKDLLSPSINITASQEEICKNTPVRFVASVTDEGTSPSYQWQLNGVNAGANFPAYIDSSLRNGDKINCRLTTSSGCHNATATSGTISMVVNEAPVISTGADSLTIWAGEQVQLQSAISGDVASYTWIPANQLNDPSSLTPVTTPLIHNTSYLLTAVSPKGCTASKKVQVQVLHKLYMPNSFTPNKDGVNDVFRIPQGVPLKIKEFSIFDRWGNRVFFTNNADVGWNGFYKGSPANAGAYIYLIRGRFENREILLKGSVVLIQ